MKRDKFILYVSMVLNLLVAIIKLVSGIVFNFSSLVMSQVGRIVEDETNRDRIPGIRRDITVEDDFVNYYNCISEPFAIITPNKVFKRTLMK